MSGPCPFGTQSNAKMTVGRAADSKMMPETQRREIEARRAAEAVAERNAEEEEEAWRRETRARNEALAKDLAAVIDPRLLSYGAL